MVKATLIIDGKEVNALLFTIRFNQGANPNGRPSQTPIFLGFKLIIETRKDINLTEWSFSSRQTKQLVLHINSVIVGGKTRKIFFYDCHLVNWKTNFSSTGSDPMTETLEITCAGVEDSNSFGVYSASWRETFKEDTVEPTVLEREQEIEKNPKILKTEWKDEEGNSIKEAEISSNSQLFLKVKDIEEGEELKIILEDADDDPTNNIELKGIVNENGEVILKQ